MVVLTLCLCHGVIRRVSLSYFLKGSFSVRKTRSYSNLNDECQQGKVLYIRLPQQARMASTPLEISLASTMTSYFQDMSKHYHRSPHVA